MDFTSTCCCCFPIRNGVIALAVMTLLEGIGEIALILLMMGIGYCEYDFSYYDYHHDGDFNSAENFNHDGDFNHGGNFNNGGNFNHDGDFNNDGDFNGIDSYYDSYSTMCAYTSHLTLLIWCITVGSVSCLSSVCLLIGVIKMMPNFLIPFVILMSINAGAYLALGIIMVLEGFHPYPHLIGIWLICWGVLVFYFVYVVYFYRKKMFQQLMNRGQVIAAYSTAVVMPGVPAFHTATPGGMYPPVMTVYPGQPGRGISTQLQPGIYAQPGSYAQPGTYANPAFYSYAGTHAYPQLGAYPQPGAYPLPGNSAQLGRHPENEPSSPNYDQPPPDYENVKLQFN